MGPSWRTDGARTVDRRPAFTLLLVALFVAGCSAATTPSSNRAGGPRPVAGGTPRSAGPSATLPDIPLPTSGSSLPDWTSLTWTGTDPAPFGGPGNQYVFGATRWSGGDVLVGEEAPLPDGLVQAVVWQSADGAQWTRIPNSSETFDGAQIDSVAARGSTIVAVGVTRREDHAQMLTPPIGLVWTSSDAVHWRRVAEADATIGAGPITGVVAGPDGFVAYGADLAGRPAMFFSADGIEWLRDGATDPVFAASGVESVTATATSYIAVGSHNVPAVVNGGMNRTPGPAAAWWSSDGRVWHASDVGSGGFALGQVQPWAGGSLRAIGSPSCGGCVAPSIDWRSTDDGRTWRPLGATIAPSADTTSALLVDGRLLELQSGSVSAARWTADGQTWHSLKLLGALPPDRTLLEIADDGKVIASAPLYPNAPNNEVDMVVFVGALR